MTTAPITVEPMQAKYNPQVGRLLVHGFRGKFQHLTNMKDDDLALFFERLFDHFPTKAGNQRMVALQEGEVIGTLSIIWNEKSNTKREKQSLLPWNWKSSSNFGKWNFLKMLIGLSFLDRKPRAGECYIADAVVHPDHRSKGVGKLLFEWAKQFVQGEPSLDILSLHVSGKNQRAKHLYEKLSFRTYSKKIV
ncbi:GNAT family N-acetyltransferase [Bacillus sp. Bva_UNVM-123]|uniref:GNAT family N-acetyltransferase n=1 Tax=Bacillus sp. Bva_UNVM-123 TaxID=2829798 RepID=UPI00391FA343